MFFRNDKNYFIDKEHAVMANKIQPDVTICGLVPNNTQQLKAIQRALSSRFSLIQGPPGMRKKKKPLIIFETTF